MLTPARRLLPIFVFFGFFASAATAAPDSGQSLPQIVRLSSVQGDVRFNRGYAKHPDLSKPWERAEINLPLESGFTIATGAGRAEIEFEGGSLAYLADNSVLLLNTLAVREGFPATELELLTGTAILSVQLIPHELFTLRTPFSHMEFSEKENSFLRVDSYVDGTSLTPLDEKGLQLYHNGRLALHVPKGRTVTDREGSPFQIQDAAHSAASTDWDAWVCSRVESRRSLMEAALKASGLSVPVPGLADMYAGGTFFPCAPYGTCWEPKEEPPAAPLAAGSPQPQTTQEQAPGVPPPPQSAQGQPASQPFQPQVVRWRTLIATCPAPYWMTRSRLATTPQQLEELLRQAAWYNQQTWIWPVCHTGGWIRSHQRYVFVVGRKHHRRHPGHWIHVHNTVGFVPRHPGDQKGKPPINLKHGVFVPPAKEGGLLQRLDYTAKEKYTVLTNPPKEFRGGGLSEFARVVPPSIHMYRVGESTLTARVPDAKERPGAITYDYRSKQFIQEGVPSGARQGKPVIVGTLNSRGGFSGSPGGRFASSGSAGSGGSGSGAHGSAGGSSGGSSSARTGGSSGGSSGASSSSHSGGSASSSSSGSGGGARPR